jgi:methylmalonyl-CoA mutase
VFLANLGKPSDFGMRATFAGNLFEAGGIEVSGNDAFAGCEEVIAAFKRSGARLACLCSSDQIYARDAVATAQALREAGAKVWLAGRGDSLAPALEGAGVSRFIFAGCDVLAALQAAQSLIVP